MRIPESYGRPCFAAILVVCAGFSTALGQAQSTHTASWSSARDSLQLHLEREHESARAWLVGRGWPSRWVESSGVFEIARIDGNRPVYRRTHNASAAVTTHTNLLHEPGLVDVPLTGTNLQMGIWDAGHVYAGHVEFGDRIDFGDSAPLDDHATHVGGTLVASGIRKEAAGMAPDAGLTSWDWNADAVEMLEAAAEGLLVSNHSYGPTAGWTFGDLEGDGSQWYWVGDTSVDPEADYTFGFYGREASRWDRVAWESPFLLPVLSAGNDRTDTGPVSGAYRLLDAVTGTYRTETVEQRPVAPDGGRYGYDTIAGQATAKNVLAVGSVGDLAAGGPFALSPSRFSSFGPVDDGRVKPDLMCNGEALLSTAVGTANPYRTASGTSMAAANCSGSLLLVQELQIRQTGVPLRAATLKGLAIHTAYDLDVPGPDYRTGWGLLDASEAVRHLQERLRNPVAVLEEEIDIADVFVLDLVKAEAGPVRVTISWTDPPAPGQTPGSARSPVLVRDLDMQLEHMEDGSAWDPYVLDPDRPAEPAHRGQNRVDPVEQIRVGEAPAGRYVLRIRLASPGDQSGPIPFSLLVSGLTDRTRLVAVPALEATVGGSDVKVAWTALGQVRPGTFVLERTRLPPGEDPPDSLLVFALVDSVAAPEADEARFELTDRSGLVGRLVYRLLFRASPFEPAEVARSPVFVPLADHDGIQIVSATPQGVALRLSLLRLRSAARLRLERRSLRFDVLGNPVLGAPVAVSPDQDVPQGDGKVMVNWIDSLTPAGRYRYSVGAVSADATRFDLAELDVNVPPPRQAAWVGVYPNPFSDQFTGVFDVPEERSVTITVLDILGRPIDRFEPGRLVPGRYSRRFEAQGWASGSYFLVLDTGSARHVQPILRVR